MHKGLAGLLVLTLLVCCVQSEKLLVVSGNGDGLDLAHRLTSLGVSVHGFYENIVVALARSEVVRMISGHRELARLQIASFDYNEGLRYFVLERPELAFAPATQPLSVEEKDLEILYSSFNRLVVAIPAEQVDTVMSRLGGNIEVVPIDISAPIHLGVRNEDILKEIYANITRKHLEAPNPTIVKLVEMVNPTTLKGIVEYLSGEDPTSNITTRNSRSTGAVSASRWIIQRFEEAGLAVSTQQFRTDMSNNVIGVKLGTKFPGSIVLVGAHYDSRGPDSTSTTQRAPGANDNGSGTGAVIHMAKILHDAGVNFEYTIHFIVYSGEEQGLYGSAAYAQYLVDSRIPVVAALNADMIAFHVPSEPTQCAFPSRYSTPNLEVIARTAVSTYVPALTIGTTTACCSDHQSYYNRGLPATGFFERNGAIADNQYHKSEDLVNRPGYDVTGQYTQLTKGVLATLATVASVA